ncbi:unnamed protein product [Aureobasidium pullulans]|nr:unnamed protein product [Aureobasidium pullulans]
MPYPYEHWEHDSWEGRGWGPPSPSASSPLLQKHISTQWSSHTRTTILQPSPLALTRSQYSASHQHPYSQQDSYHPRDDQCSTNGLTTAHACTHASSTAVPADAHDATTHNNNAETQQQRKLVAATMKIPLLWKQQIELERRKEEASAAEAKRIREEEANALKLKLEVEAEREAIKRKQAEEDAAADRQRVIDDYERKRLVRSRSVRRELMKISSIANVKREAEEERAYREALRKQKEKEEAKEREYQAFLREQKEKQEAEDQAKKEEQARIDSVMRARLEKLGYSQHEIELALDPEKAEKEKKKKKKHRYSGDGDIIMVPPSLPDATPMMSVGFAQGNGHVPVYPRINRKFLDIETLEHYHVPWEWDRANSEYIILLRELDKYETDVLFEHTRRRRQGLSAPLLIEKSKDKAPNFAWVRRKSKDRSKSRGRDIRVTEIVRR